MIFAIYDSLQEPPTNSALSPMNLAQTLAAIAKPCCHHRAAVLELPVPIRRLEEEPPPTPPTPEMSFDPERRRTPCLPPLKAARAAFLSPTFSRSFPPPKGSKTESPFLLDHVGRNLASFHAS
jgi:hypothetical protein